MQTVFTVTSAARMLAPLFYFVPTETEKSWELSEYIPSPLGCHFTSYSEFSIILGQTSVSSNFFFLTWTVLLEKQCCLCVFLRRAHYGEAVPGSPPLYIEEAPNKLDCFEAVTQLQSQIWIWYKNSWNLKDELKLTGRLGDCLKIELKPWEIFNITLWVNRSWQIWEFLFCLNPSYTFL